MKQNLGGGSKTLAMVSTVSNVGEVSLQDLQTTFPMYKYLQELSGMLQRIDQQGTSNCLHQQDE